MALVLLVLGAASCGGGNSDPPSEARACLEKKGLVVNFTDLLKTGNNELSTENPLVELEVSTASNRAKIDFAFTDEAQKLAEQLNDLPVVTGELQPPRRRGKATVFWTNPPTDDEAERVESCLA